MGHLAAVFAVPQIPLFTYRVTWRVDEECIDHLVMAHNATEARLIASRELSRILGAAFDSWDLEAVV